MSVPLPASSTVSDGIWGRLAENNWTLLRRIIAGLLVFGAVSASVFAVIWLVGDFVALSVQSPNLDPASHVADFDEFAYIGEKLRSYRFKFGLTAAVMAVAMVMLAVYLLQPRPRVKGLFVSGAIALLMQVIFLAQVFYLPFFLMLVCTALALFLAPELASNARNKALLDETELVPEPDTNTEKPETVQARHKQPVKQAPSLEKVAAVDEEAPLAEWLDDEGWEGQPDTNAPESAKLENLPPQEAKQVVQTEPEDELADDVDPVLLNDLSDDLIEQVQAEEKPDDVAPTPDASKPLLGLRDPDQSSVMNAEPDLAFVPIEGRRFGEKSRVWNLMDWIILGLMVLGLIGIGLVLLAR